MRSKPDLAEKRGAIAPAEREGFKTRISTANTAADAIKELHTRKGLNTKAVEINGSRVDLSTANARANALTSVVQKRMKEESIGYDDAFAKCKADPQLKALFDAWHRPVARELVGAAVAAVAASGGVESEYSRVWVWAGGVLAIPLTHN